MFTSQRCLVHAFVAGALAIALAPAIAAAAPQEQDEQAPEVVTRVYTVRPLVAEARAAQGLTTLAQMLGGTAFDRANAFQRTASTPLLTQAVAPSGAPTPGDDVVTQIVEIIQRTVEPNSWTENGGQVGTIAYLPVHSRLVVTHTEQVHQRVAQLLGDLQDREVVCVRAKLVRLAETQIQQRIKLVEGVSVLEGDPADIKVVAEIRLSGFDGQTQEASDGRRFGYFESVQPIVADSAVGYQAALAELQTGMILKLTPVLSEDGTKVTLEVSGEYLTLTDASRPATQPAGKGEAGDPVLPDRLTVDRSALETRLRIRVGSWVLVGTLSASRDGQASNDEPLHLLIRIDAGGEE